MLNLRKKTIKNLQTNTYSTLYYLYIKHKYFLNCALYQKSFFFINYLLILKKFIFILKFKTLFSSMNLKKLFLPQLIIKNLILILQNCQINKLFINFKKIILKNYIKILNKTVNYKFTKNLIFFNKRWNLL